VAVGFGNRRILAFLSACGVSAGASAYIGSFSGVSVDAVLPLMGLLFLGAIALISPIVIIEYPASRTPFYFYSGFARGMPNWVAPCEKMLALIALAHFIWFGVHSGLGFPAIQDGQYVLESRSQVLRVLSQAEYFSLKEAWLRLLASMMISFYFVPMMYWWFRRSRLQRD
jgi:hypothetical protein